MRLAVCSRFRVLGLGLAKASKGPVTPHIMCPIKRWEEELAPHRPNKEMLHPERRFQLCPGFGNVLNPDPAQSKSKGPALDSPGTQVADLLPQTPSRASRASRAVAMENVIGMVSAKWAEWDAYVEPLVFTYIEKVSFFRSRWWWQRCKRFLVCLYCQRKAAARSQRPAPQLQALTHHFSHPISCFDA